MKTVCIYHSIDLDGWMSAAIAKINFVENNTKEYTINDYTGKKLPVYDDEKESDISELNFFGWNYGDEIPDLSNYDKIIMCDVSFGAENMDSLYQSHKDNFIWIDHHISAIKALDQLDSESSKDIEGLRDTKFAACELTWKYFFPNDEMPEIVRLLGRYDCWGHKGTEEEQKVLEFQYGARQWMKNYEDCFKWLVQSIFPSPKMNIPNVGLVDDILDDGITIYRYLCSEAQQVYKKAFDIELQGYRFLCINKGGFNASSFNLPYTKDGYDGFASFTYSHSKKAWTFTLRSETIDVSEIAKQYGGGGHKGASGFVIEDLNQII